MQKEIKNAFDVSRDAKMLAKCRKLLTQGLVGKLSSRMEGLEESVEADAKKLQEAEVCHSRM